VSMDEDDDRRPPIHWGDFGALFLAGGFSLFSLYLVGDLLLGGHPMAVLFRSPPAQTQPAQAQPQVPSAQEQMAAPFQTQPGEVVLSTRTMTPVKRPAPVKPKSAPHAP
jgi:hypothetical protein